MFTMYHTASCLWCASFAVQALSLVRSMHCAWPMCGCAPQAILAATTASFKALGSRLRGGAAGADGAGVPFFEVAVELVVPSVGLNPSMATIQAAINASAEQVATACAAHRSFSSACQAPSSLPGTCLLSLGWLEGTDAASEGCPSAVGAGQPEGAECLGSRAQQPGHLP